MNFQKYLIRRKGKNHTVIKKKSPRSAYLTSKTGLEFVSKFSSGKQTKKQQNFRINNNVYSKAVSNASILSK